MKLSNLFLVLSLVLAAACTDYSKQEYVSGNVNIDSTYNSTDLEYLIAPYRSEVDKTMNEVIGHCDSSLVKYAPESPLGNFTADVVFEKGISLSPPKFKDMRPDNSFALLNFGGLRAPINSGDITIGNVFELMPFDNTITIVHIDAGGVMELMEYLYTMNGQPVSNAKFDLSDKNKKMFVADAPVQIHRTGVYVITSNYLASGGDKMNFLKNSTRKWDSGVLMRDAFIDYIRKKKTIDNMGIDGRMKITR